MFNCSICNQDIAEKYGNNAEPVNEGTCCNDCNLKVVIPARLIQLQSEDTKRIQN